VTVSAFVSHILAEEVIPYMDYYFFTTKELQTTVIRPNLHSLWLALRGSVAGGGIRERIAGPNQSVMFITEIVTP